MLSFRRITRQGSSRRIDSGRAQAGVDGGDLTSPRARTSREGGKPTLAAVMASHAKLERRVAEQEAELAKLRAGHAPAAAGAAGGSGPEAPPDLLAAAERGDADAVRAALQANKALVDAKNRFGRTPLMEAARKGHLAVVDVLVAAGADLDVRNKFNQTAADWALEQGHPLIYARQGQGAGRGLPALSERCLHPAPRPIATLL